MFQFHLLITVFLLILNKCSDASVVFNQCGTTISRYQFILQSPDQYPANINCEFILEGHHSCATEFHFQLVDFDTPFSRNCTNGLEIIGHESLCGYLTGVRMYKTHKNLHLRIKLNKKTHFKIVITRIPCSTSLTGKTYIAPSVSNSQNYPNCCADSYNSRKFFLASPGFPQINQNDCIYKIYRANPNICRLRINVRFLYIKCEDGFLEIDSKKICGCQSDLDIISQFDQFWGNREKVIRYKNMRTSQGNYNGFVIEVIQDECPTRYSPSLNDDKPQFYYYNDQLNRVRFPLEKNAEMLTKTRSKLVDYYFFRAPDYDDEIEKDREERNYFESTDPNGVLPETDVQKCINWGFNDFQLLVNEVLWQKMPKCFSQELKPSTNCFDVKLPKGYLISPGYSFYNYPPNINCCYRFHRLNNFCGIHFSVLDFQLEASYNCDKDALILYNKYKYCGTYLYNKYFKFDLSSREYEEIKFQTDAYYCNKGFKIYFEHIPCSPSNQPPVTTNAPTVAEKCGGNVRSEIFDLTIPNTHEECVYVIHKINQDVCGVKLHLLELNLSCEHEYLLIKDREYCGLKSGETKWETFDPDNLMTIAYRRRIDHRPVLTSIMLRGQQITEDCDPFILDVPAQRRLKIPQD